MNPITTLVLGLVFVGVGALGLLRIYLIERHHKHGPIPDSGPISGAQFKRLPKVEVDPPHVIPLGNITGHRRAEDVEE